MHNGGGLNEEGRRVNDLKGLSILVVDDYQAMRRLVRKLLIQIGFSNIELVADGATALAKLHERSYSVIISDLKMEPMSGLGLLRVVRREERLRAIPFIVVTAANDRDDVIAAKKAGANDYIVKPFSVNVLRRKLAGVLNVPGAPPWLAAE
jgi:two-component system chemotaxis response regulator CheY